MSCGHSSSTGIVFYDTSKKNENAVFCRYFSALFGIFFGLTPKIGFFFFLLAVFLAAILLFFNFLKPLKPFLFFESFAVKEPSEKEILLAAKGIEILSNL